MSAAGNSPRDKSLDKNQKEADSNVRTSKDFNLYQHLVTYALLYTQTIVHTNKAGTFPSVLLKAGLFYQYCPAPGRQGCAGDINLSVVVAVMSIAPV